MNIFKKYPGTPKHQRLLQAIVSYYQDDPRILVVSVFGSLGRGNWDQFSDLDLDVVIEDEIDLDVAQELEKLCTSFETIGEKVALIIPDGNDAGDVVLGSLLEFSIRYHPLQTTSPNIIDGLQVLTGRLDLDTIKTAGQANQQAESQSLRHLLDMFLRYAVEVDVACRRERLWEGIELLHRMRGLLMELFARTHNGVRATQVFQAKADEKLQRRLRNTLPRYDLNSVQEALTNILKMLEHDLVSLTNGQVQLTDAHYEMLYRVRVR